jgi:drug/metabolite transporter (DMT)-like permease
VAAVPGTVSGWVGGIPHSEFQIPNSEFFCHVVGMMASVTEHPPVRSVDRLMILVSALLFSTGGAAVKMVTLSAWQVASLRSGVAAAALLVILPEARRGWNRKTWIVGTAYATTMITFVLANKLTTAANAVFLQSVAPLYLLLLGPILLHEPIRRHQLVFMAALAGGMSMIFAGAQQVSATAPDPLRGNLIGIVTGIAWACTLLGLRWLGGISEKNSTASPAAARAVVCGNLIAFLATVPLAVPVSGATRTDWLTIAFLGIFQIAIAYVILIRGIRRVGALEASLLILLEPVLSPLWAWIIHGERPSELALLGGAVIIAATATYTWHGRKQSHTTDAEEVTAQPNSRDGD